MAAVCMFQAAGARAPAPTSRAHPRRATSAASTTSATVAPPRRSPLAQPCRRRALILPRASHRSIEDAEDTWARPGG